MSPGKKIYFASDLHLGVPDKKRSIQREKHFVKWLDFVAPDAARIYLMGDVFDFWFEYKRAVPKGYIRLLGKLAELADKGIEIHFFVGNHDLWTQDYFTQEFGAKIYREPVIEEFFGKKYHLHHGDGLGPGDHGYKLLKAVFTNPICRWLFGRFHPDFGIRLADYFSRLSRKNSYEGDATDYGENEFLWIYSKEKLASNPDIDYLIFGHRHLPKVKEIQNESYYVNLGDWLSYYTYAEVSENGLELKYFLPADQPGI